MGNVWHGTMRWSFFRFGTDIACIRFLVVLVVVLEQGSLTRQTLGYAPGIM